MATKSKLIPLGRGISIVILILGIIHEVATFTPFIQEGLVCLSPGYLDSITYFSLMCGAFLILNGLLLFILLRKLVQYPFLYTPILIIGIFLSINGILSVYYMSDNPFAWMVFILCICIFGVILGLKNRILINK